MNNSEIVARLRVIVNEVGVSERYETSGALMRLIDDIRRDPDKSFIDDASWALDSAVKAERRLNNYSSGFRAGDRVVLRNLEGRKYNPSATIKEGSMAVVLRKTNVDFPEDAVRVQVDNGGFGTVDARCLKAVMEDV